MGALWLRYINIGSVVIKPDWPWPWPKSGGEMVNAIKAEWPPGGSASQPAGKSAPDSQPGPAID